MWSYQYLSADEGKALSECQAYRDALSAGESGLELQRPRKTHTDD